MVELNDEDNLKNDDIKTVDGMDFETNKGYFRYAFHQSVHDYLGF